jgi:predicted Rossmann fold nucleotide-binding protein DprA/Smf involved in DNA uptake
VAARCRPEELAADLAGRGIGVTWWGADDYPDRLRTDPQPPGVLFWRGDLTWLTCPCVALVGTRRATPDGRATAFELGRDLAAAGICVVSGLALGIDGAAHSGALSLLGADPAGSGTAASGSGAMGSGAMGSGAMGSGTVGVAASGVDRPYPLRHAELWERVIGHGAVCSETPPGYPAQAWRFPARNRVIAGLSQLVVVVESHRAGGSLLTAEAAIARGIDVAAVPGPVRSPASEGTNQLLADGPAPVRHAGDVLDMLGRVAAWPPRDHHQRPRRLAPRRRMAAVQPSQPSLLDEVVTAVSPQPTLAEHAAATASPPVRLELSEAARQVLDAVPWRAATLNQVVAVAGLDVAAVAGVLDDLEVAGLVASQGSWWRRVPPG